MSYSADTVGGIPVLSSFYATFPILCGIDVSYDMLPVNPALCFIPVQFSLRQAVPDVIQPLALRTSSPSLRLGTLTKHYCAINLIQC